MKRMMYMPLGFAVLCLAGCRQEQTDRRETLPPVKVKTMQVTTSTTAEEEHRYSGTIEETAGTPLSFPVMGTVSEVHFKVGNRVGKGQLLATLDPTSMQSSLDAAQATLAQAEDAYARMKELHDKGSLAEIKWVEVQSKLRQARSMEELARKNRNDCNLYAPFGGVMADKSIEVGQNVLPGVSVGKIVGVGKLKVKIAVPENEITRIALQQRAEIRLMTPGGGIFHGAVSEKGIVANPLSRSYEVKLTLDDAAPSLMPGMVAEVIFENPEKQPLFVIPAWLVQLDEQNRSFVWVNQNGKAKKRFVTIGTYTAQGVTVAEGLSAGDEIITEGQQKVSENREVCL